jgi:hypothetical protein
MRHKAPLVLLRDNDAPPIVVRVGQLWAIGRGGKKRRIYAVIGVRRLPDKAVQLWDGFGRAERAEWVPLGDLLAYEQVGAQGNLGRQNDE